MLQNQIFPIFAMAVLQWSGVIFLKKDNSCRSSAAMIIKTKNKFFTSSSGYGKHEVITDTNSHKIQLWDTSKEHIKLLLDVISQRINALQKLKGISYVLAFKNHGKKAGTSIIHSHVQIAAVSVMPPRIK